MTNELVEKKETAIQDFDNFERSYRLAAFLSKSDIIPKHFKGKEADCFLALEMSQRTGASFLEVAQNLFVVHGTPSWKATFVISQINRSKMFDTALQFKTIGMGDNMAVMAHTTLDGEAVQRTVTMSMAKAEGWTKNPKYKSMPEQMLSYRSACFFCRAYCPEVLFGMYTQDEMEDVRYAKSKAPIKVEGNNAKDNT